MTLIQQLGFYSYAQYWQQCQKASELKNQQTKADKPSKRTRI